MKDNKQITCQCGLILLTGDEIYRHLSQSKHQLKTTTYDTNNYHLIEQSLAKWRLELYAALQMLQGEHLEEFKKLIAEIATLCKLEISDTGTFTKQDVQ